jgi:hypothetical protein
MASRIEIVEAIEALAVHCRPPLMGVDERDRWLRDWCDDLKNFTDDAIKTGCARWRQGTNPKFPLPGQLLPLVRAVQATGNANVKQGEIWRELTDAEYDRLTMRENIRHQQILASNAYSKAGPQLKAAEEMPDAWHLWRKIGAEHAAEARQLQERLNRAKAQGQDAA